MPQCLRSGRDNMSIRDRIEEAVLLYKNARPTGALLEILVAVAGTSRKRWPRQKFPAMGDREAFVRFLKEQRSKVMPWGDVRFTLSGKEWLLEDFLYEAMRCHLQHEGELPSHITFGGPRAPQFSFQKDHVVIGDQFLDDLARAVIGAKENANLFPEAQNLHLPWEPQP